MANWAELPLDVLTLIQERVELVDQVRSGVVCKNWRIVQQNITWFDELPWLVVCENDDRSTTLTIFSVGQQKIHQMDLPELRGQRCCGSSQGWLITIDLKFEVHLFHPLLKTQIDFPSLPTFWTRPLEYDCIPSEAVDIPDVRLQHRYIQKAIFLGDPYLKPTDCVVMIIYGNTRTVACCRIGDKEWKTLSYYDAECCQDIIYHKEKTYAVTYNGTYLGYDEVAQKMTILDIPRIRMDKEGCASRYLVEDCEGYLLQIIRYRAKIKDIVEAGTVENTILPHHRALQTYYDEVQSGVFRVDDLGWPIIDDYEFTIHFDIFRFDSVENRWKKVESLGDQALFLGRNFSTSLNISKVCGCKPNTIYFTDDIDMLLDEIGYNDLGVYLLEDKRIEPCFPTDILRHYISPPVWLVAPLSNVY